MDFEDLRKILIKYGDILDEEDIDLFEKTLNVTEGKIIVDGTIRIK